MLLSTVTLLGRPAADLAPATANLPSGIMRSNRIAPAPRTVKAGVAAPLSGTLGIGGGDEGRLLLLLLPNPGSCEVAGLDPASCEVAGVLAGLLVMLGLTTFGGSGLLGLADLEVRRLVA